MKFQSRFEFNFSARPNPSFASCLEFHYAASRFTPKQLIQEEFYEFTLSQKSHFMGDRKGKGYVWLLITQIRATEMNIIRYGLSLALFMKEVKRSISARFSLVLYILRL